jgi:hypothetical protein
VILQDFLAMLDKVCKEVKERSKIESKEKYQIGHTTLVIIPSNSKIEISSPNLICMSSKR